MTVLVVAPHSPQIDRANAPFPSHSFVLAEKLVLQAFFLGVPHISMRSDDATKTLPQLDFVFRETMREIR